MRKIIGIIVFMLFGTMVQAQNPEIWGTIKISGKLSNKWVFEMEGEDRYNFTNNDLRYFHYDIGVIYSLNKRFGVGGFYRDIFVHKGDNHIKSSVPHIDFFYSSPQGFKLRIRNEYIIVQDKFNSYRLRIRPGFQAKWFKNFNPFIQDEIFLAEVEELSRNRFHTGIEVKLDHFSIEPGYMLESDHTPEWTHRNILWINTKVKF